MIRTVVALVIGVAALSGCEGPTATRADLDRVANEMLDLAEVALPAIAESLGATLTEAYTYAERAGGVEGVTPEVRFKVHGTMVGPEPTQAELEQALVDAGFTELVNREPSQWSDGPRALGMTTDGTTEIYLNYSTPGGGGPGIQFIIQNVDPLRVSNATVDDFRDTFPREFDETLVHEAPEIAALRQRANEMLDLAEAALPALAESLGATITYADMVESDDDTDEATALVRFSVYGWMGGATPTQAELEQALIDAGFTDIESPDESRRLAPGPYAGATSADGTVRISIEYSNSGDPNSVIYFDLESIVGVQVADFTLEEFMTSFEREFDQTLVHEAPASGD